MRLIDADALLASLRESYSELSKVYKGLQFDDEKRIAEAELITFTEAILRVKNATTIDAVPVVRCKDCKHGKTWKNAFGIDGFKCDLLCVDLSPEAFCSYGVRKDGGNDE